MIAKVSQRKTFKGALQYALKPEKGPELIAGNMYSVTATDLTREFVRNVANSRIKNKMWFSSLSLSDQDKKLSSKDWGKIAKRYAEEMGFGNAPYIAVRHYDTEHPHIHLIASRVDFKGKTIPDGREYKRAEAFCRKIEKEMGLIKVPSSADKEFSVGRKRSLGYLQQREGFAHTIFCKQLILKEIAYFCFPKSSIL